MFWRVCSRGDGGSGGNEAQQPATRLRNSERSSLPRLQNAVVPSRLELVNSGWQQKGQLSDLTGPGQPRQATIGSLAPCHRHQWTGMTLLSSNRWYASEA